MRFPAFLLTSLVLGFGCPCLQAAEAVSFNRDIRPILSDTCFHCHGPDQSSRKAGLRLDLRDEALKAGKSGNTAIVPGKPEQSEVIQRIFTTDHADLMPPEEAHKTLSPEQKELFRRWIAEGAVYEAHWAYTPLAKPALPNIPPVADNRATHPIDLFIQAKLTSHQLQPSPPASKRDQLRRLSLDLTGLPPTPAEMDAFLADASPDAYGKQIDRLLNSPHYGERMAVWWMDLARFTDTVGYHGDQNQRIFPYRDYVINAFNTNKSFKQFTLEQLAGDLLPHPTTEQLIATGFNRLNMMTREGGAQPKEYLAKYGAERARTIGTAWLGSTFGCAECHDHKFDPISQRDFYSLQAYFADVKQWGVYSDYRYSPDNELRGFTNEYPFPPEIQVESPYLKKHHEALQRESTRLALQAADALQSQPAAREAFESWRHESLAFLQQHPTGWETPFPTVTTTPDKSVKGEKTAVTAIVDNDSRILFSPGTTDVTRITLQPGAAWLSAIRVELLPLTSHGGSILRNNQESARLQISASLAPSAEAKATPLAFRVIDADRKDPLYSSTVEHIGIGKGWKTSLAQRHQPHTAIALLDTPLRLEKGSVVTVTLSQNLAGCVKVSLSPFADEDLFNPDSRSALLTALPKADVRTLASSYLLSTAWHPGFFASHKDIHQKQRELREGKTWTMITQSVPNPLTVRLLPRGNWMDESGPVTPPATPEFLPVSLRQQTPPAPRQSRLELAEWLCSEENPLTARAVTNRLWKEFFGNGLSIVVDDLGAQGEAPSHPELLDWIATEFRDSGWNFKQLIRLIVTSHTYRQSSNLRPELRDLDPNNRLLASQNPRRLEAEFVRDNALFVSGLLNLDDIGGPSVKPYQPEGYYGNLQFPNRDYLAETDNRQYRRGLYMHWQRTFLHPMLANFDAPAREECTAFRPQSNTPQQALTLLNDPTFVEAARALAQRLLANPATGDAARLDLAFQLTLSRPATDAETSSLLSLLNTQRDHYRQTPADAQAVLQQGLHPVPDAADPIEIAAWTQLCRVLLNLHESITRY